MHEIPISEHNMNIIIYFVIVCFPTKYQILFRVWWSRLVYNKANSFLLLYLKVNSSKSLWSIYFNFQEILMSSVSKTTLHEYFHIFEKPKLSK